MLLCTLGWKGSISILVMVMVNRNRAAQTESKICQTISLSRKFCCTLFIFWCLTIAFCRFWVVYDMFVNFKKVNQKKIRRSQEELETFKMYFVLLFTALPHLRRGMRPVQRGFLAQKQIFCLFPIRQDKPVHFLQRTEALPKYEQLRPCFFPTLSSQTLAHITLTARMPSEVAGITAAARAPCPECVYA